MTNLDWGRRSTKLSLFLSLPIPLSHCFLSFFSRFVPALGMILGNAISGIGIGVSFTLESFHSSKDKVETLIAHGASRTEACRPVAVEALRLALLPVINREKRVSSLKAQSSIKPFESSLTFYTSWLLLLPSLLV